MTLRADRHVGDPAGLTADWDRLHAATPGATPFSTFAWTAAWWRHYGPGHEPLTLVVRDAAGTAVGLAALTVRRRGPARLLTQAGTPPGDEWDVLASAEHRDAACRAVAEALHRDRRAWDAWGMRLIPPGSPLPRALATAGVAVEPVDPIPAPQIELPTDFETYLSGLSSSRRSNLRKHLRRLDEGVVALESLTDVTALPGVVDRWQALRRRQWDAGGKDINPEHLSPRFGAFVLDALRSLLPAGMAEVWRFTVDGDEAGLYVNWVDPDAFHWYLGGFDPAHGALGLGKIAIAHGIRSSVAAGRARFDFGFGAEPYKYWYGAQDRPLAAGVPVTRGVRGRVVHVAVRAALARRARAAADAD